MYKKILASTLAVTMTLGGLGLSAVQKGELLDSEITASASSNLDTLYDNGFYYTILADNTLRLYGYEGESDTVVIPSEVNGMVVTSIGYGAFWDVDVKTVIIPDSVTTIREDAFGDNETIETVIMGDSLTTIGKDAFRNCTNLKSVIMSNVVSIIDDGAFYGCTSLKSITIPGTLTKMGEGAFCRCTGLETVTLENGVREIGEEAFKNCTSLKSITIPGTVASTGVYAFWQCTSLESVNIKYGVTRIDDRSFGECSNLHRVVLPNSIISIGEFAFSRCDLTSLTLPNSLTHLEEFAFSNNHNLTGVVIPNSVVSFDSGVFYNCEKIKSVTIPKSVTIIDDETFGYDEGVPVEGFKVYCYEGTAGETFGIRSYHDYEFIDENTHKHSYQSGVVAEATCQEKGTVLYTCACGENYTKETATTDHTVVTDEAVAATCMTAGKTEGSHCSVCGKVIKAQTTIKPTGHTVVKDKGVEATCLANGLSEGSHCSVCGEVIKAQYTVETTSHDYDNGKITKSATCTDKGVKTYTCKLCKATTTKTVKATGHDYVYTKTVSPTLKAKGYKLYTCSVCKATDKTDYVDALINFANCKATISSSTYTYTGKTIKPTVTVKYGSTKLKSGTDYTVSYKNNTKTGQATITIKGKGKYSGTITKRFNIVPKKATLSSVTSKKTKQIQITWKKDSQATGYQIVYSTNSKFKSSKSTTVTKSSTNSKTISNLTKGKTYYVRVRAYKIINGKKVYGAYSSTKKITCK